MFACWQGGLAGYKATMHSISIANITINLVEDLHEYPNMSDHADTLLVQLIQGYFAVQGAEVVKEDLIDDIAKESGPYHPPEKIMRRSDMATDFSTPQQRTIKPNE